MLDGLCKFYVDGGGFRHDLNGERNAMATEQCYYALAAYFRMKAGKTALYDMSDVTLANTPTNPTKPITPATPSSGSTASADTGDNSSLPLWLGGCLCSAAAILVLLQEKKRRAR